jgi:hypothetical protein
VPAEPARAAAKPPPGTPRPAGVDDRLGEVLDAVAEVVRRHRGLSVMVAIADGHPGRPVIRVTERAGEVETGLVVAGVVSPPKPEPRRQGGRHAADDADDAEDAGHAGHGGHQDAQDAQPRPIPPGSTAGSGRSSWHDALWSADRAAPAGTPDRRADHGGLRLVPDLEPAAEAETPAPGAVALEASTSQVVSRLAQLLREDPSLASSWGREAPDS